jgi:AraC family transcriptional regulator
MEKSSRAISIKEACHVTRPILAVGRTLGSRHEPELPTPHQGKLPPYKVLASILTDSFHINVSEFSLAEPFTTAVIPRRPGFTMLMAKSSTSLIELHCKQEGGCADTREKVIFMVPGKEIGFHYTPGAYRSVCCSFDPEHADRILGSFKALATAMPIPAFDMKNALISCILLRLMNETLNPGPISITVAESLGNALLVECAHQLLSSEHYQTQEGGLSPKHIQIIERYLSGPFSKVPTVSELAATCRYSERHFAKLFREQYGCSASKYIKSAQISKAKVYLLETDLHLKEVAHRLGFSSLSHFSQAFRDATGCTPGQFRKEESSAAHPSKASFGSPQWLGPYFPDSPSPPHK